MLNDKTDFQCLKKYRLSFYFFAKPYIPFKSKETCLHLSYLSSRIHLYTYPLQKECKLIN